MTIRESTIVKVQQLPESLLKEVNDFIDFIAKKHNQDLSEQLNQNEDFHKLAVSDFSTYLKNLEKYEDQLARGEIQW